MTASNVSGNLAGNDAFLTTEEVLAYLQINLRTVYRLIKAGKIPAVRVGRQWRFRKRDLDAWLNAQQASTTLQPPQPAAPPRRARVLVVDDEGSMRDLLVKTLGLAEYDVETAPDGIMALSRLRDAAYDLLVADLRLPGMDGLSLIRQARTLRAGLPVLIVTGYSDESSAVEAVNLGVAGYLRKPFRVTDVLAAAARALEHGPRR